MGAMESGKSGGRKHWVSRFLGDLVQVARTERSWWLLPLILILLAIAGLALLGSLSPTLAPFIYVIL